MGEFLKQVVGLSRFFVGFWKQVGAHQTERLEPRLRDALALPFADGRLLDVEKTGHCGRSTQFIDELFAVHGPSIGSPIALSIGSPIFLLGRLT